MKTLIALALAAASLATQAQTVTSKDGRTVYKALPSSLRTEGAGVSMLWAIIERGKTQRLRMAVTGCEYGSGIFYLLNPQGVQLVPAEEWADDGGTLMDGIARETCALPRGPWLDYRVGAR